jgi:hypothetical protein
MSVEFVLCAARIDDNVSSQLTVFTHSKTLIRKPLIRLYGADLLRYCEATHHELAHIGKLAGYYEQVVPFFDLAPDIRATSSEACLRPEVRVFYMLPKLRIITATGYEDFSNHD